MAGEHRHPHARARHREVGDAQDLAALVAQLLLLVGLARPVVDEAAGQGEHVVGHGPGEHARSGEVHGRTVEGESGGGPRRLGQLLLELVHAGWARPPTPTGRWRRRGARSPASRCSGPSTGMATMVVQFGLATIPLAMWRQSAGVDLGDHERHVGVHAPRRGVVDDERAGVGQAGGDAARGGCAHRHERDVDAGIVGVVGHLHLDLAVRATAGGSRPSGARRGSGCRPRGSPAPRARRA